MQLILWFILLSMWGMVVFGFYKIIKMAMK